MGDTSKMDVLVATPNEGFWRYVNNLLLGYHPYNLIRCYSTVDLEEPKPDLHPFLAIVQASEDTLQTSEWVQTTRQSYPECPLMVLYTSRCNLDFKVLKKNGADQIMHIPYDEEFVSDIILELAPIDLSGDSIPMSALHAISISDLIPLTTIEFDIYLHLPSNQKTLLLRRRGSLIDDKVIEKVQKVPGQRVYIKKTDLSSFIRYATDVLKNRGEADVVPMTKKAQEAKRRIMALMAEFLDGGKPDYQQGKQILEQALNIIRTFGLLDKNLSEEVMFKRILEHTGQPRTIYNDVIGVCLYTAIFARVLKEKDFETAALAGVLHNIGMSQLSKDLIYTDYLAMSPMEQKLYAQHPSAAVRMVKERKVPVTPELASAIEQQGERLDGTGFPRKLKGDDVGRLPRILAIAQRFQQITSLQENMVSMLPMAAIDQILEENKLQIKLDTTMLAQIRRFIAIQSAKVITSGSGSDFKPAITS